MIWQGNGGTFGSSTARSTLLVKITTNMNLSNHLTQYYDNRTAYGLKTNLMIFSLNGFVTERQHNDSVA